ncbi:hypothetical protein [uncultured Cellulomonas sp.]|uniref:hypothetical protein n=1 Tax=uncultured Cellulomonas sp. TaxID=189682 RepID=UPI00261357F5|nr:hypothetical protein [uncultured Cellulomonas sp.]
MTQGPDAAARPPGGPRVPRADRPPAAPPRPALDGEGFAAAMELGGPPPALVTAVLLWLAGSAAALVAVAALWMQRAAVQGRLAAVAVEQDPSVAADVVAESVRYAFAAAAGGVALVAVVHAALALLLRRGRSWARPALVVAGALGVAVAVAVQELAAAPDRALLADPVRVALLVHAGLVVAALGAMLTPSAGRWLRRARALRR